MVDCVRVLDGYHESISNKVRVVGEIGAVDNFNANFGHNAIILLFSAFNKSLFILTMPLFNQVCIDFVLGAIGSIVDGVEEVFDREVWSGVRFEYSVLKEMFNNFAIQYDRNSTVTLEKGVWAMPASLLAVGQDFTPWCDVFNNLVW